MLVALLSVTCAWSVSSIRSNSIDFSADLDVVRSFSIGNRSIVYRASNKANIKFLERDWDRQCVQKTAWEWRRRLAAEGKVDVMDTDEINALLDALWTASDEAKLLKDDNTKKYVLGLEAQVAENLGLNLKTAAKFCKRDDRRVRRGAVEDCINDAANRGVSVRRQLFREGWQETQATQGRGGKPGKTLRNAAEIVVQSEEDLKIWCKLVHPHFKQYQKFKDHCTEQEQANEQGREELANHNFVYRAARNYCANRAEGVEQDKPMYMRDRLITKLKAELNDPVAKKDKTCQTFPHALCPEGTHPNPTGKCQCVHQTCDWNAATSTCELAAAHPHPAFGSLPYPGLKCISVKDQCLLMPCSESDLAKSAYHLNDTSHTKYRGTFGKQSSDGLVGGKLGHYNCLSEQGTRQSSLDLLQIITDPRPEGFQSYNSPMARGVLYDHLVSGEYVAPQQQAAPKPAPTVTQAPATAASTTTRAGEDIALQFDSETTA